MSWKCPVSVPTKPTRVAAPSPRASPGRRMVCGRAEQRTPPGSKRCETKARMVWGSFLIAASALKTPTRNGYTAQGVKLKQQLIVDFMCCLLRSEGRVWVAQKTLENKRVKGALCAKVILRTFLLLNVYK